MNVRRSSAAVIMLAVTVLAGPSSGIPSEGDTPRTRDARFRMVAMLEERYGLDDPVVLRAMSRVPRHQFVQPSLQGRAYDDRPLPIGYGQTISQPLIVAYMTHIAAVDASSRALEIGSGSGYQAAILAEIADEVYTIEIIPGLARNAGENLRRTGYTAVRTKQGDGYYGWEDAAPFDVIIVTAASPRIPPPLVEQLRDGGRMIIPVGPPYRTQQLVMVTKEGDDLRTRNLMAVRFVPFTRSAEP